MYTRVSNMDTLVRDPTASLEKRCGSIVWDRLVSLPSLLVAEVPPSSSSTSLYIVYRVVMVVGVVNELSLVSMLFLLLLQ